MIKIKNINKSFGDLQILKDINLEIAKGEIVTIIGKSGAGKTTLLQIIGTLLKADSGRVDINDIDVSSLKDKKISKFRNEHIGFIFQFHNLLPEFTAVENVCIPAYIGGKSAAEAQKRANELLDFLNLGHRTTHKPRALINSPDVILADEPSGNLDTVHKMELHNLFFQLRDDYNQTFVIVTHDEQLAAMSDRTIRLRDGVVIEDKRNNTAK
jgi:lipoprotein-releasing system ATP-binding protein